MEKSASLVSEALEKKGGTGISGKKVVMRGKTIRAREAIQTNHIKLKI